jgi:hypothetical protein
MRQSALATIFLATLASLFHLFLPYHAIETHVPGPLFKIVVVGKIDKADPDAKVGEDVFDGANALSSILPPMIRITHEDDQDLADNAKKLAKTLESDPQVLAVIGHSLSATTRAAAESYSEAQIPFIVPVATAQLAVYPSNVTSQLGHETGRFENAFRLRPGDDNAQAPAVSYLLNKLSQNAKPGDAPIKVHLVISTETKTKEYSEPLGKKIRDLISERGFAPDKTDEIDILHIQSVADEIVGEHGKGDVVIFCGYPGESTKFLAAIQIAYSNANKNPPILIFTEAATDIEKQSGTMTIYRTVPEDTTRCTLPTEINSKKHSAEFIAGFDSIRVLNIAINTCLNHDLSRPCLLQQLQTDDAFPGACRGYSFRHGESVLSNYYVLRSSAAPSLEVRPSDASIAMSLEISPGSIVQSQATRRPNGKR